MGFLDVKEAHCKCSANKGAIYEYTFDEHYGNAVNKKDIDVLILLEFKEVKHKLAIFKKLCDLLFKNVNYVIIPALGCTPEGFSTSDVVSTYSKCKKFNVKRNIDFYNPKTIITTGRALYTITESKDLKPNHFFIPIGDAIEDYQLDDCWLYTPEFKCKVFPIPALYQWISQAPAVKDVYEYKFVIAQFKRALASLQEKKVRRRAHEFIFEENPNEYILSLIKSEKPLIVSIDTESSGLNYFEDELYTIQFSIDDYRSNFCLFKDIDKKILIQLFDRKDFIFVMQNAQHDVKFFIANDIENARCDFDTMLAAQMLNENSPNGLKPLTWVYTEYGGYEAKVKHYLKKYKCKSFLELPRKLLLEYACTDSIVTYQLYEFFIKRFELEEPFIKENFYKNIMPAQEMIIDVEMTGVQIDKVYLEEYVDDLKVQAIEIEEQIYEIAGYKFNLRSSKEMSIVLRNIKGFKVLKDDKGKELLTKNGDLVLNKEVLERYFNESDLPFIKKISSYNHLTKEISQLGYELAKQKTIKTNNLFDIEDELDTNEKGFLASIYKGRLHGGYKLHGTGTGRMSGGGGLNSTINWQNMPTTRDFRKLFLPSKNSVMAFADYDAMEVCIFSQISGPGTLEDVINEGKDMHCYTCVNLFELIGKKTTYEEVFNKTKIEGQEDEEFLKWRGLSKNLNFQALYGATGYGIGNLFDVPKEEGQKFLDAFYTSYPEVAKYITEYRDHAKKYGWVRTLLGRKRRLPELTYIGRDSFSNSKTSSFNITNLLNGAINAPVQGTSGQTTVIAMTNIWKDFKKKNLKSKVLINVHDEIVFELFLDELEETCKIIKYWMEKKYYDNIGDNKVVLIADVKYGELWKYGYGKKYWDEHPEEWKECIETLEQRNISNEEYNEQM